MKFCKDCNKSKKEVVQVGPNPTQLQSMLCCSDDECRNPVDGSMFPCDFVRREPAFCGITAKHFEAKPEQPAPEAPKGSVIQLK